MKSKRERESYSWRVGDQEEEKEIKEFIGGGGGR